MMRAAFLFLSVVSVFGVAYLAFHAAATATRRSLERAASRPILSSFLVAAGIGAFAATGYALIGHEAPPALSPPAPDAPYVTGGGR